MTKSELNSNQIRSFILAVTSSLDAELDDATISTEVRSEIIRALHELTYTLRIERSVDDTPPPSSEKYTPKTYTGNQAVKELKALAEDIGRWGPGDRPGWLHRFNSALDKLVTDLNS